ncbi:MAG: class I SAM-dependent methyltransferase [Acidocella sp.]|nr:class I SAM-dependent methyltransferase [Acidocella sp.]
MITGDMWSNWLLHRRQADDNTYAQEVRAQVAGYVDRVLEAAMLRPGMVMLDVGSGEGVVAWRAIERVGPDLRVILTDISPALLDHARAQAQARGVLGQCVFVLAGAEDLAGIADGGVDVVTARSVLAYVADKNAALRACHRVLRPGGCVSLAEPVFRDEAVEATALRMVVAARAPEHADRFLPLMWQWKAAQFPDTEAAMAADPLTNYTERDLLRMAREAGFGEVDLTLHMQARQAPAVQWEVFLARTPHPRAPSLAEIMASRFDAAERDLFEQIMRPVVEAGGRPGVNRLVYMKAVKGE